MGAARSTVSGIKQIGKGDIGGGLGTAFKGATMWNELFNSVYKKTQAKGANDKMKESEEAQRRDAEEAAKQKRDLENRRMGYLSLIKTSSSGLTPMNTGSRARLIGS